MQHGGAASKDRPGRTIALALLMVSALWGCAPGGDLKDLFPTTLGEGRALLKPRNNSNVTGTVSFTQRGDKVAVVADIHELTPGQHSLYIHQVGNCTSPNAASAGKVWTLPGTPPGAPRQGDLPALVPTTEGNANVLISVRNLSVGDGKPTDVIGHAVVVHAGLDPNPDPQFGVRNGWLACGVIEPH
jgi:superoxide dismutase, Cu-Zn family